MLRVHPVQFLDVEHRARFPHPFQREFFLELLQREDLPLVAGVPAEKSNEVDEGLRGKSPVSVLLDGDVSLAFAQFRSVRIEKKGEVCKQGYLPSEVTVQKYMLRRAREPFFPPDDMRNPHQVVIHHVGQVIRGIAVGFQEDLVVDPVA